jgi:hypothetical protein
MARVAVEGWPEWLKLPSKVGQVAAVRILARKGGEGPTRRDGRRGCMPGLIATMRHGPGSTT